MIGKFAPGLTGFPTPNTPADILGYLLFYFDDPVWAQYVLGACESLTYEYNWYEAGDLLPEEASEAFRLIVQQAPYNLLEGTSVPTPYWDEDSEVDDQESDDTQTWYGTVTDPEAPQYELDFVENAAIMALTGLLAVATWEIGAYPAILFHTIAPKFVIAMRRGDVGEVIRILIDGEEAARVDTSSHSVGDVIDVPIVADPELDGHDIAIVQVS